MSDGSAANTGEAPLISLVVPVYEEADNVRSFLKRTVPILARLGTYEIIFCLDPSSDNTEELIRSEIERNSRLGLLVFSRRFGQPAATLAGILNCRGRWCAAIDVDLQDPPEVIEQLLRKAQEGYDVVTARRLSRDGEGWIKKLLANTFYWLVNKIAVVPIPRNTGDFRIISRRVIEELRGLPESHGFLRGLVSMVGYPQVELTYARDARFAGTSNYSRFGSLKIGFNGIFGFSTLPLQIMMWTGFAIAALSAIAIFIIIAMKIYHGNDYPMGTPTITILVLFIGGVQLAGLGVLGEYVGRIYDEVRHRPLYIVHKAFNLPVRDARGPSSRLGAPVAESTSVMP
jgi:dolichol-phosphate mannosyltransferase